MSRFPFRAVLWASTLMSAGALPAQAQEPHSRRSTSAVEQLGLDDTIAGPASGGNIRELRCRGKAGIDLRIHQEPSPRLPKQVAMALRYERPKATRAFAQEGMGLVDYGVSLQHLPGTCTWNPGGIPDIPPEPGVVYFDLPREGQAWLSPGDRDTTINAAVHFPDVASLSRYLSDPERYWVFYVDDATDVAISFSAWPRGGGLPPSTADSGPRSPDSSIATWREHRTTAAGTTRAPTSPASSPAGPLRDASPDRAASEPAAGGGATSTGREPGIDSSSASRESPASRGTSRLKDTRRNRQAHLANGIRDVTAAPGPLGVRLSFHTDRGARVRVQFSKNPPQWDEREGRLAYPAGWNSPWYAEIEHPFGGTAYEAVPRYDLEVGARYYYLITVDGVEASSATRQRRGAFTASVGP